MVRRGHYKKQDVIDALERVHRGEPYTEVARTSSVPLRTLFKNAKDQQSGIPIKRLHRGTKPAISADLESPSVEWITAMQRVGLPVARIEIMKRAILICDALQKRTRASLSKQLPSGWYSRFLDRHTVLVIRTVQSMGRVQNAVGKASVDVHFNMMAKLLIEHRIDSSRVFNMDETSFTPESTTRTIIAIEGSGNLWTQKIKTNFHMSVVEATMAMHPVLFTAYMWSPQSSIRSSRSLQRLCGSRRSVEQRSTSQAVWLPKKCL